MEELQARVETLENALLELRREKQAAERHARQWRGIWLATVPLLLLVLLPGTRAAVAQTTQATLAERVATLETKVANLQTRLAHFTRSGNNIYITGANLHIRSGLKATNGFPQNPESNDPAVTRVNGLGNLIIGYHELRGYGLDDRTGSHNLVLGLYNNYGSYGGLVAGQTNTLAAPYASVSGGMRSTASGLGASVSGGFSNRASGYLASIGAGAASRASGNYSSVCGGSANAAVGSYASVSGGIGNSAVGSYASVSGGYNNRAGAYATTIGGGRNIVTNANTSHWWAAGSPNGPQLSAGGITMTSP